MTRDDSVLYTEDFVQFSCMREKNKQTELSLGNICFPGGMGPYSSGLQARPVGPDQIREGFVEAKYHVL